MKQLVQTLDDDEPNVVIGLHACALAIAGNTRCELTKPPTPPSAATGQAKDDDTKAPENDLTDIQAVALTRRSANSEIWYAVARQDKSLALYCKPSSKAPPADNKEVVHQTLKPVTIHKTAKRVSCLCFAHLDETMTVVIAGDLAGDVVAFPLRSSPNSASTKGEAKAEGASNEDNESSSRLLLGHTASMLTGLHVTHNKIFSSDRDEKIRVSAFPDTHIIDEYLLGHKAFVSCFDVNDKRQQCISGSGDGTLRLWDYSKARELARYDTLDEKIRRDDDNDNSFLLPTKVLFTRSRDSAVAIYDGAPYLDLFSIASNRESPTIMLSRSCRVQCEAQPLAIALLGQESILVVTNEPMYVQVFRIQNTSGLDQPTLDPTSCDWTNQLRGYGLSSGITMPDSILERDKLGNLKMSKVAESRGPAHKMPWNDESRKQTARESNRRAKKRRHRQSSTT